MKMYKIEDIVDLLLFSQKQGEGYVGFTTNEAENLIITVKTHEPDWRDEDGIGEAVIEYELQESVGEY